MATASETRAAILAHMSERIAGGGLLNYSLGGDQFGMLSFKELLEAYQALDELAAVDDGRQVRVSLASFNSLR